MIKALAYSVKRQLWTWQLAMAEGLPVRSIIETLEEGIQDEGVDEQEEGSEDEDEGAEDANCNAS